MAAAARAVPRRDVEAVVLFSDGIHNAAGDPVAAARKLGVVVHAIGVGNSLRNSPSYRDVRVADLECPEQLPVNNRARITAHVGQSGLAGQVVKAVLEEDGKPLDQAEVVLRDGDDAAGGRRSSSCPRSRGGTRYTVRIPPCPRRRSSENNHRSAVVQVVDSKIRVLYIEGTLRAEYGALVQRFLSKDPDLEFCALVQTRPNVFLQRTNMEGLKLDGLPADAATLEKFDVIMLGDLDSTLLEAPADGAAGQAGARRGRPAGARRLSQPGARRLRRDAARGDPAGPHGRSRHRPDHRPVPAHAHARRPRPPDLRQHRQVLPDAERARRQVAGPAAAGRLRAGRRGPARGPGAGDPSRRGRARCPCWPSSPSGKGRAAVFTGDTTRNWQQVPQALDQESPFLRFWGQMVRWLANRTEEVKAEAGITARTDKAYYEPDSPITVAAAVRDKEGRGPTRPRSSRRSRRPQGTTDAVTLAPVAGSAGTTRGPSSRSGRAPTRSRSRPGSARRS